MKKIILLGELGKKFGREFNLSVKTPAEAVRALCINFPALKQYLIDSDKRNIGYKVLVDKQEQKIEEIHNPSGNATIKIVPVLMGSGGNGIFGFIIGATLVAASFIPGNPFAAQMFSVGVSMMIGGVVQMLSPVPKTPKLEDRPENKPSYIFNGAVNTSAQGYPVPVGYGKMIVGSAVISASIVTEELAI